MRFMCTDYEYEFISLEESSTKFYFAYDVDTNNV